MAFEDLRPCGPYARAHLIDGTGCRCALAPHPRLSHKRVPMDQTFSWKLAHHVKLLGKETWSTRVEHLEALLFGRRRNKRHFGDSMLWSRFVDTDGAAMTFRCRRRWTTEAALLVIQRKRLETATWTDKSCRRIMRRVSASEEEPSLRSKQRGGRMTCKIRSARCETN